MTMTLEINQTKVGGPPLADFSVKEVAERLDIHPRTIVRMIHDSLLPGAYKINPYATRRSEWRIPEEAIIAVEEKREQQKRKFGG